MPVGSRRWADRAARASLPRPALSVPTKVIERGCVLLRCMSLKVALSGRALALLRCLLQRIYEYTPLD